MSPKTREHFAHAQTVCTRPSFRGLVARLVTNSQGHCQTSKGHNMQCGQLQPGAHEGSIMLLHVAVFINHLDFLSYSHANYNYCDPSFMQTLISPYTSLTHHAGSEAVIILSTTPESRNVSEGKIVEFSCATPDSGVNLGWITIPPNVDIGTGVVSTPPEGGKLSVLSFTATAQHNNVCIICFAFKYLSSNQSGAILLVQGIHLLSIGQ